MDDNNPINSENINTPLSPEATLNKVKENVGEGAVQTELEKDKSVDVDKEKEKKRKKLLISALAVALAVGVSISTLFNTGTTKKSEITPTPPTTSSEPVLDSGVGTYNIPGINTEPEQEVVSGTEYSDDVRKYIKQAEYGEIISGDVYLKVLDRNSLNIIGEHTDDDEYSPDYPIYEYNNKTYIENIEGDLRFYSTILPYYGKTPSRLAGGGRSVWAKDGSYLLMGRETGVERQEFIYKNDVEMHGNKPGGKIFMSDGSEGFYYCEVDDYSKVINIYTVLKNKERPNEGMYVYYNPKYYFGEDLEKINSIRDHISIDELLYALQFMTIEDNPLFSNNPQTQTESEQINNPEQVSRDYQEYSDSHGNTINAWEDPSTGHYVTKDNRMYLEVDGSWVEVSV